MPTNDPDVNPITQEALLEQLKRQHERICLLEARLAEGGQSPSSEHADAPAPENWMAPEDVGEWPDPPPASLSQWLAYYTDALLDRTDTGTPSAPPNTPKTVPADETGNYEPTLRFDTNRLRRAHRRLEAGQRRTGWRTSLTLTALGVAALALVQWQQHPVRLFLSAPEALQVSAAPLETVVPPETIPPLQTATPLPGPSAAPPAVSSLRSIARSAPAVPRSLNTPVEVSPVRLAQTRRVQRHRHDNALSASSPVQRLALAATRRPHIASADTSHSALPGTRSSFASKSRHTRTQIASAAMANGKRPHPLRLVSLPDSSTASLQEEPGSSRTDLSEQSAGNETLTTADTHNDIQTNVDHAIQTLDKMRTLLARMEQHKTRATH